jgi:hypothetical protein
MAAQLKPKKRDGASPGHAQRSEDEESKIQIHTTQRAEMTLNFFRQVFTQWTAPQKRYLEEEEDYKMTRTRNRRRE